MHFVPNGEMGDLISTNSILVSNNNRWEAILLHDVITRTQILFLDIKRKPIKESFVPLQ